MQAINTKPTTSNTTLVIGHRNPDNDAICAAVGYAYLKSVIDPNQNYIACRQGPLPDETKWILNRMGIDTPPLVPHVHSRVKDAMSTDVIKLKADDIMLDAGRLMKAHDVRILAVENDMGKFMGVVTESKLAEIYIDEMDIVDTRKSEFTLGNAARACGGSIILGDENQVLSGHLRVAASEPETFRSLIEEGDTVVMGDRVRSQRIAVESKVACLILAVGAKPSDEIIKLAMENGVSILCAKQDTYTVTRLVTLAQTVDNYMEEDPLILDPDALLTEIVPDILHSHQRAGVVLDQDGKCEGIITRSDIAVLPRRKVILVDHNERAQSVPGIDEADVLEVVDHHRIGDIQTTNPIRFISLPWGSSATIVADQFEMAHIGVPKNIAGVLLSAVLTDTVLLKSPTTTPKDREIAYWLGSVLGVDPIEFGVELFHRRGNEADLDIDTMVLADSKEFEIADMKVLIAQHETADMEASMKRCDEIQQHIEEVQSNSTYNMVLFLLTDIVNVGSRFFVAGNRRVVERAFDIDLSNGSVWVDGILSRKKQVVTKLMRQN